MTTGPISLVKEIHLHLLRDIIILYLEQPWTSTPSWHEAPNGKVILCKLGLIKICHHWTTVTSLSRQGMTAEECVFAGTKSALNYHQNVFLSQSPLLSLDE